MGTTELKMVKNNYSIPSEQLDYYRQEIMELLPKYRFNTDYPDDHYAPTEKGVNKLLEVYNKEKGWMYPYFMSHPNYIGNGKIAFSADYHRKINVYGAYEFYNWIINQLLETLDKSEIIVNGMTYSQVKNAQRKFQIIRDKIETIQSYRIGQASVNVKVNNMDLNDFDRELFRLNEIESIINTKGVKFNSRIISRLAYENYSKEQSFLYNLIYENPHMIATEEDVKFAEMYLKHLDFKVFAGQKISKVVNKFCKRKGIHKLPNYGRKFSKFSDDINELDIKRHTIISINPIDYLTMSFGNSWKSCHTIDKLNDRHIDGQDAGGCYSGGTLSYMLDGASIVYYTVDSKYNGTDFEFQPKVNRCMFHLGEDKLIQGRVYPQSNDGDQTIYEEIRAIMQKITSEMFNVNNLWINKKGTSECGNMTTSYGMHYRDYRNFNSCNVSYLKPEEGKSKNVTRIIIGHSGICPQCGNEHSYQRSILCRHCANKEKLCPHCGRVISSWNQAIEIDGQEYCGYCAHYCDFHQRWEIDTNMVEVAINAKVDHYGRRLTTEITRSISICNIAIEENPERFKRDCKSRRFFDTSVWTDGCVVNTGYNNSTQYYALVELAKKDGFKPIHTGEWYSNYYVYYDRRTKEYYHRDEWNFDYNCPTIIVDQVMEQQAMLARRAERRAAREARRTAENAA